MRCTPYREAVSARMDGEDEGLAEGALDAHLAACAACREWVVAAAAATRSVRVRAADPVPDLTPQILRAVRTAANQPSPSVRWALALVGAAQVTAAVPDLLGNDFGAPVHVARDAGAWVLALGVAFGLAAWRPARAVAFLPVLAVFAGCLVAVAVADVVAGRAAPSSELPHLMAALGVGLVWLEAHPPVALLTGRRPTMA